MKQFIVICVLAVSSNICLAEKNTDISATIAKPGKIILDDNFDKARLD